MREIKFRAWDKSEEEMIDNEAIFGNELCVQSGYQDEDFIFMQYTGLKDKNGVEIYDGDIIKSNSHKPTTFKIEFIEGGFCATQNDKDYPLDINHFYPSVGCMIEVIGNIYENPELLEK